MVLKHARRDIALWSLQRAAARVGGSKRRRDDPELRMVSGLACKRGPGGV